MRKRRVRVILLGLLILLVGPWLYVRFNTRERPQVLVADLSTTFDTARVYVLDWGHHTSIVVPRPPSLSIGPANAPGAPYVEYAWGNRSFYMESNYWPHRLFADFFLPTESVEYLEGWDHAPGARDGMRSLYSRTVSAAELQALIVSLERSIRRDSAGNRAAAFPVVSGYAGHFYPAAGYYLFWSDCNRWTVDRLHDAGLAESGAGVLLPGQIPGRLRGFAKQ
jgi:hypothetical protein